jgi:fused signal recognition particle receptor
MAEDKKKPGFLQRLFGRKPAEDPAPSPERSVTDEDLGQHFEPGPPETSDDYAEKHIELAPEQPEPTPDEVTSPEDRDGLGEGKTAPTAKPKAKPKPKPKAVPKPKAEKPAVDAKAVKPAAKPKAKPKPAPKVEEPATAPELPPAPEPMPEPAPAVAEPEPQPGPDKKKSWFQRLTGGLKRTSDSLTGNIAAVFTKKKLDAETLEQLEDVLIQADLGVEMAMAITEALAKDRYDKEVSEEEVRGVLASEVEKVLSPVAMPLEIDASQKPFVILVVGVNGTGKTTTIGKLASGLTGAGKKVTLAAGDTFRAAAIEQLQIWGERTGSPVVTRPAGSDASGLAYDALKQARGDGTDVLIIDTAGRLQNRDELMAELEKIIRVIKKLDEGAPHATLLTLDATTGQNALNQVEVFGQRAGVTGLVMTKLDSTARGGILVAIARKFGLPVHYIGVGEGIDDLEPFEAGDFARAIAGTETV